jgi:hypothetical protein
MAGGRQARHSVQRARDSAQPPRRLPNPSGRSAPPSPPKGISLRLVVTTGAEPGQFFDLHPGPQVIGREEGSDIQLQDSLVSNNHAVIRVRAGRATIEDLHSTNGTRVNGVAIASRIALAPGDEINIGGAQLVVEARQPAAQDGT